MEAIGDTIMSFKAIIFQMAIHSIANAMEIQLLKHLSLTLYLTAFEKDIYMGEHLQQVFGSHVSIWCLIMMQCIFS